MHGPQRGAEVDEEILRAQGEDWSFVLTRLVILAMTFFFLARAVGNGASAGFLLLPLFVEFGSILWLGLALGYSLVDCPRFLATTFRPGRVLFWTMVLFVAFSVVLGWEGGGGFDSARILPGWTSAWQEVWRTGLLWAVLAEVLGLVVSTGREVALWRRARGPFVWRSVSAPSYRVAVVALLAVFSPFVLIPLADSVIPWLLETPQRMAWTAFGLLLFVEVSGLMVAVALYPPARESRDVLTHS